MEKNADGNRMVNKLTLIFMSIFFYHLILYLTGVLDIKAYGAVIYLGMLASIAIVFFTTPYQVVNVAPPLPGGRVGVVRPRVPRYLLFAATTFTLSWVFFYALERLAIAFQNQASWPVSSLSGAALLALASCVFTLLIAVGHYRLYRQAQAGDGGS